MYIRVLLRQNRGARHPAEAQGYELKTPLLRFYSV